MDVECRTLSTKSIYWQKIRRINNGVDECHSLPGAGGNTGRGVTELFNIRGEVDIITGTLRPAFGGAPWRIYHRPKRGDRIV